MENNIKIKNNHYKEVIEILKEISSMASKSINDIYASSKIDTIYKKDKSPLTQADIESNNIIISLLKKHFKDIQVISEESDNITNIIDNEFFLIDPLDGTKEFIKKNDEFTVNICLIQNNQPILGVVEIPPKKIQYFSDGFNSYKLNENNLIKIESNNIINEQITIVVSRSHLDQQTEILLEKLKELNDYSIKIIKAGSSLKLCLISEGKADLYIRYGNTMEWDMGAGHAILKTANGYLKEFNNNEITYGKNNYKNSSLIGFSDNNIMQIVQKLI